MDKKYILALDQGTTSSRCIIFDKNQQIVSISQKEIKQYYPFPGWVEHDPLELLGSQREVMEKAILQKSINPKEIAGIGIANQRETTIIWDKLTGKPIHNAIVWQCRRTAEICAEIQKNVELSAYIRNSTGLIIDAYFSATKIKWLLDNIPDARKKAQHGELLFGTVDSWLIWNLTEGKVHVTDYTNASRTMLYNIHTLEWDQKILDALDIPKNILPSVCNSSEYIGMCNINGVEVPISGVSGDQQASLFGQNCYEKGDIKNTYGTGNFILLNTGNAISVSNHGLLSTIAYGIDNKITYALEGSVFVAGAVLQWLRDEIGFFANVEDADIMASKAESGGVYFVPAFTGLGTPHWDMNARGCLFGLTRGTTKNQIIRAAMDAISFQSKDVIDAMMSDTGLEISSIKVDGGVSASALVMQFQADITEKTLILPKIRETTALGAAYFSGLAVGFWNSLEELKAGKKLDRTFIPNMDESLKNHLLSGWNNSIQCAKIWRG